jgi:hypothetical protein
VAAVVLDLGERARANGVHPTTVQSLAAPFADAGFAAMTEHELDEGLASTLRVLRQIAGPEAGSEASPHDQGPTTRDGTINDPHVTRGEGAAPAPTLALGRALASPPGVGVQLRVVPPRRCREAACDKSDVGGGRCTSHGGGKRCVEPTCDSGARKGGRCIAHGGGVRCVEPACGKTAADARSAKCLTHGGGKRCDAPDCDRPRRVGSKCGAHAGVNVKPLCVERACRHKAISEDGRCKAHGGRRRCTEEGCANAAVSAKRGVCAKHAPRRACSASGCGAPALARGACGEHGGARARKRQCAERDCDRGVVSGDRCVRHGGGGAAPCRTAQSATPAAGGAWRTVAGNGASRLGARAARWGARTA